MDWSDHDINEEGASDPKQAELGFEVEDGRLALHIRRGTGTHRDMAIFLGLEVSRAVYEALDEWWGGPREP
jgi:hypothetical protein